MAHFNEAHTRIYVSNRPDDLPPLKIINFGEKIIVNNVAKSMVDKIPLGSEIIKINDIPVVEYLCDSVFQYIAASTAHWKFDKAVTEMLYGEPNSTVNIKIKTQKGEDREVKMLRDYNSNINKCITQKKSGFSWNLQKKNTYLCITLRLCSTPQGRF